MASITGIVLLLAGSYLVGAIPFGYVLGRMKGIDLFTAGSGNIGATNAGRVLGRRYGVIVFALDFLKGAIPVATAEIVSPFLELGTLSADLPQDWLAVGAAALALLGHLFPIYLGFRGGKGVATGAGIVFVLVPGPAILGLLAWITILHSFRFVSLASLAAAVSFLSSRLLLTPHPFDRSHWFVTVFCIIGTMLVVVKHLPNIYRLIAATESRLGDWPMREPVLRTMHILALGTWFGGAAFFNFVSAPLIFASFERVVEESPSDRTAHQTIIPSTASAADRKALSSALAGSAVGPIFPRYYLWQAVCGGVALLTAFAWWTLEENRFVHRARIIIIMTAFVLVIAGWPLSEFVSQLRLERFHPDSAISTSARASFATYHVASLALSAASTLLAGIGLAMAGVLPNYLKLESPLK